MARTIRQTFRNLISSLCFDDRGFQGYITHTVICAAPSSGPHNDDRYFRSLIHAIPRRFRLTALSADKAYLDMGCFDLLDELNMTLNIAFMRDSVSTDRHSAIRQVMYAYYDQHREQFLKVYHPRSNAEAAVGMIKRLSPPARSRAHPDK